RPRLLPRRGRNEGAGRPWSPRYSGAAGRPHGAPHTSVIAEQSHLPLVAPQHGGPVMQPVWVLVQSAHAMPPFPQTVGDWLLKEMHLPEGSQQPPVQIFWQFMKATASALRLASDASRAASRMTLASLEPCASSSSDASSPEPVSAGSVASLLSPASAIG